MNYVRRVLQPGEAVVHVTRIHPIIFLPAILWFVAAVVLLIAALSFTGDLRIAGQALAVFCLIFAAASALPAFLRRISTELAVTDRRVIYKSGIIARHTLEMNRGKVESVDVDQSVLGRFIGFGTIVVRGTGGSLEPIRMISDPLTFRSHITAG
jgi:uncharacterized membrane protein YdbT with pleckstrin-like domain